MDVNAQYNVSAPDSLANRVTAWQRRKMYARFLAASGIGPGDSLLDVGVTSDQSCDHSNYLELWYPDKAAITAVGLDDAGFLERLYPGVRFVRADGRCLPFADRSFDYVHAAAVLEHVGDAARQTRFLAELWRVARKGVFVTTPNRWFPIEVHTVLPLLHWLPPELYRRVLRRIGRGFFASEDTLNLLSAGDLAGRAAAAGIVGARIESVALAGWPSNLILRARREG